MDGPMSANVLIRVRRFAAASIVIALVAAFPGAPTAAAQAPSESEVKAALIYKFLPLVEWPGLAPTGPLVMCVISDNGVAAALTDIVKGKTVGAHTIEVRQVRDPGTSAGCHMVFVAGAEVRRFTSGLTAIRTSPFLTISDGGNFVRTGGIIEFFIENGGMKFSINTDAVNRSGLRISSQLLRHARIVRD
jgi:hypothetical protein